MKALAMLAGAVRHASASDVIEAIGREAWGSIPNSFNRRHNVVVEIWRI